MKTVTLEKKPLQSKKMLAYLIAEISWKLLMLAVLILLMMKGAMGMWPALVLIFMVLVCGFLEVGTILGIASLDKFVRVAAIGASIGRPLKTDDKGNVVPLLDGDILVPVDDEEDDGPPED